MLPRLLPSLLLLPLLLLLLLLTSSSASASAASLAANCSSLRFVTSLTVAGCQLRAHLQGNAAAAAADVLLEPAFCIQQQASIANASIRFDPLLQRHFLSFPLLVRSRSLLQAARQQLVNRSSLLRLRIRSVNFMQVTQLAVRSSSSSSSSSSSEVSRAAVVWSGTEDGAFLRIGCSYELSCYWQLNNADCCLSIRWHLQQQHYSLLHNLRLTLVTRFRGCSSRILESQVSVANDSVALRDVISSSSSSAPLRSCQLVFTSNLHLHNCTVRVHRRMDRKGHFVLEPLLCMTAAAASIAADHGGRWTMQLLLNVTSSSVLQLVRRRIRRMAPKSVEFMQLAAVRVTAAAAVSRWQLGELRLRPGGAEAEMPVSCDDLASCQLLSRVLTADPISFWQHIRWTVESEIDGRCRFESAIQFFGTRLRSPGGIVQVNSRHDFLLERCRSGSAEITRAGRRFLVIQQRLRGHVNFNRNWTEYENGFGDNTDFWIGLKAIHELTRAAGRLLRVEATRWSGAVYVCEYIGFTVGDASTKYTMDYATFVNVNMSHVTLDVHKGMKFSTFDNDNDMSSFNCAAQTDAGGGFWFKNCAYANPNGRYSSSETSIPNYGMIWYGTGASWYTLKSIRLMLEV